MKNEKTKKSILTVSIISFLFLFFITGCTIEKQSTKTPLNEKPYSAELENKIKNELINNTQQGGRPDYLPSEMFSRLPEFPKDFYQVQTLIKLGRIKDLENLEPQYWMQPEFFPNFNQIGLGLLQNPPKGRWGAYGIATYPGDSVSTIVVGESLDLFFFIKSNYLVETYQGINFNILFPKKSEILSGFQLLDGSKEVEQDSDKVKEYFKVKVDPNPFILEPNYPIYNINGTRKIKLTITVSNETPPGNYVVALDTGEVPDEYEQKWLKDYLTLYTSGSMTKIDRPYYQAFIQVVKNEK